MTTFSPASAVVTVISTISPGAAGMPGISTPVAASESVLPELAGTATVAGVGAPATPKVTSTAEVLRLTAWPITMPVPPSAGTTMARSRRSSPSMVSGTPSAES